MTSDPPYKRILLKLGGEALAGLRGAEFPKKAKPIYVFVEPSRAGEIQARYTDEELRKLLRG